MDNEYWQSNSWSLSRRKAIKMMGIATATTAATFLELSTNKSPSSATNSSIPYVISPRNTFVETRRPKLRWNPVSGTTYYTVKIATDSGIVWQREEVKEAEFNSSEDLPLEAGVVYSLIVESDNGRSSQMDFDTSKVKFQLLQAEKKTELSNKVSQIKQLKLTEEERVRFLVDAYIEKGLNAQALEILEETVANVSWENPLIFLEFGQLQNVVGFLKLAEEKYRKAISLASDKELKVKISAKTELAELLFSQGRENEAKKIKAELDILKSGVEQVTCRGTCPGRCGECFFNGDPNDPGKCIYDHEGKCICLTAGC